MASPVALLMAFGLVGCASEPAADVLSRIAFGSCARSDHDQPIWSSIVAARPELFLFIGDNIYADLEGLPESADDIRAKYDELARQPGWQRLQATCPVLATWDDHDYGADDAGVEWHLKQESQRVFLEFFGEPEDSPRWQQPGVYQARTFGPPGRRIQVILLDTRYHRTALTNDPERHARGFGPYVPNADGDGEMLGAQQWEWLGRQLEQPAELRIIASSVQVVAWKHGWEAWGNMPHERRRLFELIRSKDAGGVIFVSGDRHLVEISVDEESGPYPMWDFTSSGFNWGEADIVEANEFRRGGVFREPNFGVIEVDWNRADPQITLEGRSGTGTVLVRESVALSELR